MDKIPVFIVNGFLGCGKTTFIKEIIENDDKFTEHKVVIIQTEEGEEEYSKEWLDKYGLQLITVDDEDEISPSNLDKLHKKLNAELYIIELNAFFNNEEFQIPDYMTFVQQISLIDAKSFKVMFNNMRKVFSGILKFSDFVIFNRCEGVEELATFRRQVRAMNQRTQIAFETSDGSLTTKLDEDLPYDLTKDNIKIDDDVYPIWYTEVYDKYEKYFNKTFRFKAFVSDVVNKNVFIVGRNVMVCCAQDIQMLGYEVINDTDVVVKRDDAIYLECTVAFEYSVIDKENTVVLHAKKIEKIKENLTKVIGM